MTNNEKSAKEPENETPKNPPPEPDLSDGEQFTEGVKKTSSDNKEQE